MAKKKKTIVAEDQEKGTESAVRFTVPAFRYKGVEYNSAQIEKAVEAGDEAAAVIVANLIAMKSGIVEVTEEGASNE